jgi:hypothetical protein
MGETINDSCTDKFHMRIDHIIYETIAMNFQFVNRLNFLEKNQEITVGS